ncbi:MAG: glutamine--fructose-6-phosphate transaminase (isomerizing) [Candidatus Melainabacteria bacterium]
MCGIVGYIGKKEPIPLILNSLRYLEYRGYDSAGVAYLGDDDLLHVYKTSGKLINLERALPQELVHADDSPAAGAANGRLHLGIGHIRWATHGAANDINAHPHMSANKQIALVHNGIIENYFDLRRDLQAKGITFVSETDTECVVQLLETIAQEEDDFRQVILKGLRQLKGAYALSVISRKDPTKLYAVRNQAPLVLGIGDHEYTVSSDAVALAQYTDKVVYLKDNEIAELSPEGVQIFNMNGEPVPLHVETISREPLMIDKKGYKHFMLKEIHEQPDVVRNSLSSRLISAQQPIQLMSRDDDDPSRIDNILNSVNRVQIIGCGTSFNAGLVGKYAIEELVRIPADAETAGEYRYRQPVLDEKTLIVIVSQSGETADSLAALRMAKQKGAKVLAVTNRDDSTIARESDIVLNVRAGVEVSVCATKSFTAQVVVFYLLALRMAELRNALHPEQLEHLKSELFRIPAKIEAILSNHDDIQTLAKRYCSARDVLFIARGVNFPVAMEGALKLKEISYIHAEGYSGSELKHGPIAMLDDQIPVISVLVPGVVFEKMISNCQEAKAREAKVVAFTSAELDEELHDTFDDIVPMPLTEEIFSPLLTTIPLQLLSYYMAEFLGKDVDQPRNLAKSVTVE